MDGTLPPVRVRTLALHWLDETNEYWVRLPSSRVDAAGRKVTAQTPHFTTFALLGAQDTDLNQVDVFPVPFRPALGHANITFSGLGQDARVRVYTVDGRIVRELSAPDGSGLLNWDVTNGEGRPVVSGVYVVHVKSGDATRRVKIVVVR